MTIPLPNWLPSDDQLRNLLATLAQVAAEAGGLSQADEECVQALTAELKRRGQLPAGGAILDTPPAPAS